MKPDFFPKALLPLAFWGLTQILSGCMASTVSNPSPVAGGSDEIDTRMAVDRTGRPVAGARIALVRSGDSTGKVAALSATGTDGTFPSFVVTDGYYSVLVRDPGDSLGRFVDSVHLVSKKLPNGRDTLLALGSVRGVVRVGQGDSPAMVSVMIFGTELWTKVRGDGTFVLDGVPQGIFTLQVVSGTSGYAQLFHRFQIQTGQNLALDTLTLIKTGLAAPGMVRALQDSVTGMVTIHWGAVSNPRLGGYSVRKIDGRDTIEMGVFQDTSWTDSLGELYGNAPYLGPWPTRDLWYQLRSTSLDGMSRSDPATIDVHVVPPIWTHSVDSIRAIASLDSVGRSTLRWRTSFEPDLIGWKVVRSIGGVDDCSGIVKIGSWSDSLCPDAWKDVIDSLLGNPVGNLMFRSKNLPVVFKISTVRKTGDSEQIQRISVGNPFGPNIVWRDSGVSIQSKFPSLATFADWIKFRQQDGRYVISKTGVSWESIPDTSFFVSGTEDSVWSVSQDTSSSSLILGTRIGINQWVHRKISVPFRCPEIMSLTTNLGSPMVICWDKKMFNGSHFWSIRGDSVLETPPQGVIVGYSGFLGFSFHPLIGDKRFDVLVSSSGEYMVFRDGNSVLWQRQFTWGLGYAQIQFVGAVGTEGRFVFIGQGQLALYDPLLGAQVLPLPVGVAIGNDTYPIVFNNEIWWISNSRLWKGKLAQP